MNYKLCRLYGLKSKKQLQEWLGIKNSSFFHSENIIKHYKPKISKENEKKRLIEKSIEPLKMAQSKILGMLKRLDYSEILFSGLKGKSFIDNAKQHSERNFTYKIDISKFFPSTSRNKVYNFFKQQLKTSSDVAKILTECTTIDLTNEYYKQAKNYDEVYDFIKEKKIKQMSHLATGAPTSMLLSYLANKQMFDRIEDFCRKNNYIITIYADDITISSKTHIPFKNRYKIIKIVEKFGHSISKQKVRYYTINETKKITGVIINKNGLLKTPNKLIRKAHQKVLLLKNDKLDEDGKNSLKGYVSVANQIDKKFSNLRKILYANKTDWQFVKYKI